MSARQISNLERGRSAKPHRATAAALAAALGFEARDLWPELLDPAGDYIAHNDQERPPGALGGKVADDRGQPAEV